MKTDYTYKIKVGQRGVNGCANHILIKTLTDERITSRACFNNIIEYKRSGMSFIQNMTDSQREMLNKQLDCLKEYEIIYEKISEINKNDKVYYYYQIVIEGEPVFNDMASRYDLFKQLKAIENSAINMPRSVIPFFMGIMELELNSNVNIGIVQSLNSEMSDIFLETITFNKENIAISIKTDISKKYNRNAFIKLEGKIYYNLAEALSHKDNNTIMTCCWDNINVLSYHHWQERHGVYSFRKIYASKIQAMYYKNMIVVYDSKRAFETMVPYLEDLYRSGLGYLHIIQFSGNKDFYYSSYSPTISSKLVIRFVDVARIKRGKSTFGSNNRVYGNICIKGYNGQKDIYVSLDYQDRGSGYRGTIIVPIEEGQVNETILQQLVHGVRYDNMNIEGYMDVLKGKIDITDDIISTWFDYCIKARKKGTHDLANAYIQMKNNLENEYATLKHYMDAYDFSKCMAIPVVRMDDKLKENYYKTLHVEPRNVIINIIKQEQIKPIGIIQPTVCFMEATKDKLIRGELPLKDYYKTKDNVLDLQYNKLKGDVIRAKTQNRR